MTRKSIVFGLLFWAVVVFSMSAQAFAEPVLIKLSLEHSGDWESAKSLGVTAFHRFDGFVLAELERTRLGELEGVGLRYLIVDEDPWSEEYFLISAVREPAQAIARMDPEAYGRVILEGPGWRLIKASRQTSSRLMGLGYQVVPILRKSIPLEYNPPRVFPQPAAVYSPNIDSLLNLVSEDSLSAWVQRLQDFQTRYSYSDSIVAARDWLYQKMAGFGIDSLWLHHYHYDSDQWNVVATIEGTARPDRVIVVGGHYDSVVYGDGDPFVWAPGADDNATGTAYTLELARILAENPLPVTVMLVPFAQEEQGLVGSFFFAQYLYNQGTDVELMVNGDMIAHNVDPDRNVVIYAAPSAMPYVSAMIDLAHTYTDLTPYHNGQSSGSDHYSFFQWGYDALFAIEDEFFYGGWHLDYDVTDSLDFDYMKEVVKMCFATVLTVGSSPLPVENLEALDAGDGDVIYLSWTENHPADNVDHYNVHFGTSSGNYDSLHQITGVCDTLFNLQEDVTYCLVVSAVNADGFESIYNEEISIAPRAVPPPPAGLAANPFGTYKIKLHWAVSRVADLDYYNVYRSEESGSGYDLLSGAVSDTTLVDSTVAGEVASYYYTVTAVDTNGNESEMSDEAEGFAVTLDQGILVVDETYEDVAFNMVNGDSINAFYQRALEGYTYSYVDHSCPTCPPYHQVRLRELGRYCAVIVHSEDFRGNRSLGADTDSTYPILKKYLDYGGKVIIEGRRNLSAGDDGDWAVREFSSGDVVFDYLNVESAYVPPWSTFDRTEEFIGAHSQIAGYPELEADSARVAQVSSGYELAGRVPGVGYVDSLMAGEVIYTFHSDYDTSTSEGKPVAFRYLGPGQEVIFFDFPLYFIQEPQATELLHKALSDLGMAPSAVEDQESGVISSFYLKQNFPNPFNAETIIEYSVPMVSQVKIAVYNILGQKVKILLDETQTVGRRQVVWDGKNDRGEVVSSGIYFYRMEAGDLAKTEKMLFLK